MHSYYDVIFINFWQNKFHGSPKIHEIHEIYGPRNKERLMADI